MVELVIQDLELGNYARGPPVQLSLRDPYVLLPLVEPALGDQVTWKPLPVQRIHLGYVGLLFPNLNKSLGFHLELSQCLRREPGLYHSFELLDDLDVLLEDVFVFFQGFHFPQRLPHILVQEESLLQLKYRGLEGLRDAGIRLQCLQQPQCLFVVPQTMVRPRQVEGETGRDGCVLLLLVSLDCLVVVGILDQPQNHFLEVHVSKLIHVYKSLIQMNQTKQIGNYSYNEKFCLGEGAFGKVYEGTSKQGKTVAIKRIDKQIIDSDSYLRASIESQIQILKKFNHPHIVKLEDMVLTANNIYIVTEYCAHGDLRQYLKSKKLTEEQVIRILSQILKGFLEIVKHNIVHRDLKPANILVHQNTFKICDFGFAKYLKELSKMNKTSVGTPMYMSPQVLKGKPYTNKTDVWSLGVLAYEMMFGRTPWQGNSEDNLYKNMTSRPLQIPHCSNYSYSLLKGMLEIEEVDRWTWSKIFEYTKTADTSSENRPMTSIVMDEPMSPQPQPSTSCDRSKSLANPRFCYFCVLELSLSLHSDCQRQQYLEMLYSFTIRQYERLLESTTDIQFLKVLENELQALRGLDVAHHKGLGDTKPLKVLGKRLLEDAKGSSDPFHRILTLLTEP